MATITPTLTLTSAASTASTPGPLTVQLNLLAAQSTTVGTVNINGVAVVTNVHTDNKIFDSVTYGKSYLYLHNRSDIVIYAGVDGVAGGRVCTLGVGEFTWMPWSGEQDLFLYHVGGAVNKDCEYWVFVA